MRTQALDGRFLGGRPPYGYQLADAGPHPNPEKNRIGQRLHRLEQDPVATPVVQRIFREFVDGSGYGRIAQELTADGILSPSGHDPQRNRHRSTTRGVWAKTAVKAILQNPRYTGFEVWSKQPREEVLFDEENVSMGYTSKQRWSAEEDWIWSNEPTHEAIITRDMFEHTQSLIATGTRTTTGNRKTPNPYLLKGMVRCSICTRKMQGNQLRGNLHYRCVLKRDYPGADHPKSLSVREEHLLPIVDNWLSELFAPANIEGTCMTLAKSQRAPQTTVDELKARRTIKECDDELANYRAALKSAPSESVAQWIAETEDRRKAAELRLRSMTTGEGLTATEIRDLVERMQGIVSVLQSASTEDRRRVYQAAQLSITYDHEGRRAKLHASPDPEVWSSVRVGGGT